MGGGHDHDFLHDGGGHGGHGDHGGSHHDDHHSRITSWGGLHFLAILYRNWLRTKNVTPGKIFTVSLVVNGLLCLYWRNKFLKSYTGLIEHAAGQKFTKTAIDRLFRKFKKWLLKVWRTARKLMEHNRAALNDWESGGETGAETDSPVNQPRTLRDINLPLNSKLASLKISTILNQERYSTTSLTSADLEHHLPSGIPGVPAHLTQQVYKLAAQLKTGKGPDTPDKSPRGKSPISSGDVSPIGNRSGTPADMTPTIAEDRAKHTADLSSSLPRSISNEPTASRPLTPASKKKEEHLSDFERVALLLRLSIGKPQLAWVGVHGVMLFFRSWLSIRISHLYGHLAAMIIDDDWEMLLVNCTRFLTIGAFGSFINALLGWCEEFITESMWHKLTERIQDTYLRQRNYYVLATNKALTAKAINDAGDGDSDDEGDGHGHGGHSGVTHALHGQAIHGHKASAILEAAATYRRSVRQSIPAKRTNTLPEDSFLKSRRSRQAVISSTLTVPALDVVNRGGAEHGHAGGDHGHGGHDDELITSEAFDADKRIAYDILGFCHEFVHAYGHTLKPAIDVFLTSSALFSTLGWQGPTMLYAYFLINGFFLNLQQPPFSRMAAAEQGLHDEFSRAHAKLVSHSEEVAFLAGEQQEKHFLSKKMNNLMHFKGSMALARFRQKLIDQWTVKYGASIVGMAVITYPIMERAKKNPKIPMAQLIGQHRTADNLVRHAAAAIGEIIEIYQGLHGLTGMAIRISEILEKTNSLPMYARKIDFLNYLQDSLDDVKTFGLRNVLMGRAIATRKGRSNQRTEGDDGKKRSKQGARPSKRTSKPETIMQRDLDENVQEFIAEDSDSGMPTECRDSSIDSVSLLDKSSQLKDAEGKPKSSGDARRSAAEGIFIRLSGVTIYTPDNRLLVKNLSLTIRVGNNILVSGPNGSGKTSLFRCLSGLWKPRSGQITISVSGIGGGLSSDGSGFGGGFSSSQAFTSTYMPSQMRGLQNGVGQGGIHNGIQNGMQSGTQSNTVHTGGFTHGVTTAQHEGPERGLSMNAVSAATPNNKRTIQHLGSGPTSPGAPLFGASAGSLVATEDGKDRELINTVLDGILHAPPEETEDGVDTALDGQQCITLDGQLQQSRSLARVITANEDTFAVSGSESEGSSVEPASGELSSSNVHQLAGELGAEMQVTGKSAYADGREMQTKPLGVKTGGQTVPASSSTSGLDQGGQSGSNLDHYHAGGSTMDQQGGSPDNSREKGMAVKVRDVPWEEDMITAATNVTNFVKHEVIEPLMGYHHEDHHGKEDKDFTRPQIFYLPQNPYICTGSLLDNVWYPKRAKRDRASLGRVVQLLCQVELECHIPYLEKHADWSIILSGGERQKLSFARLLFHSPSFAALDEATSAVSQEAQENLYNLLANSNVTFFSIAHRPEIRKFHQSELKMKADGNGGWSLDEVT